MKLNLGCGHNKQPGFVNVDAAAACQPDEVVDLEAFPWPWPDDSAELVLFHHSLEHLGGDPKVFLRLMQELYRVCAPDARVLIHAPHPRSDNYIGDPTHVRIITPQVLSLFDRQRNDEWQAKGQANSPLAHYTGVDFKIEGASLVLQEPYASDLNSGALSQADVSRLERTHYNVGDEWRITLIARKSSRA